MERLVQIEQHKIQNKLTNWVSFKKRAGDTKKED